MKSFITQTFLISSLMLSSAYARDQRPGGPQMSEESKAAFDACAEEVGMPDRDSGERPTKEQHESFRTCLQKKGVEMPHGPGGKGRGGHDGPPPPPRDSEDDANE